MVLNEDKTQRQKSKHVRCNVNRSTYRLTGPAGIRPQQTQRLDWCGCGREAALALSSSLSLSPPSLYGCTLICYQQSLVRPRPLIAAAAAAVSRQFRHSTGTMQAFVPRWASEWRKSRQSTFIYLIHFNLTMLGSDGAACVCHPESWASLNWTSTFPIEGLKLIMSFCCFIRFNNYELQGVIQGSFKALIMNISLCDVGLRFYLISFSFLVH